jgi:hypothetical protein
MTDEAAPAPDPVRLGDDIEDWCTRCRGISTHAVAGLLDGKVLKVLCRACLSEHKYRHGKGGKSKEKERQKLIEEVLKSAPFRKV